MSNLRIDAISLTRELAQFKGDSLTSLFDSSDPQRSGDSMGAASEFDSLFNVLINKPLNGGGAPGILSDALGSQRKPSNALDLLTTQMDAIAASTPTTPTALDSLRPFSHPGQNMITVMNRVEVSFKAQFAQLSEMRKSLLDGQDAAQALGELDAQSSNADIKAALDHFVAVYNDGVNRFAPDVGRGGVLEGSPEAIRARFATMRDINHILTGSEFGLKGGLATLGISADPRTGLATVDHQKLDAELALHRGRNLNAINDFADAYSGTVDSIDAPGHAHGRQLDNLNRAVNWIRDNRAAVEKEFGPGAAATPDEAFANAAARYDAMAKLGKT